MQIVNKNNGEPIQVLLSDHGFGSIFRDDVPYGVFHRSDFVPHDKDVVLYCTPSRLLTLVEQCRTSTSFSNDLPIRRYSVGVLPTQCVIGICLDGIDYKRCTSAYVWRQVQHFMSFVVRVERLLSYYVVSRYAGIFSAVMSCEMHEVMRECHMVCSSSRFDQFALYTAYTSKADGRNFNRYGSPENVPVSALSDDRTWCLLTASEAEMVPAFIEEDAPLYVGDVRFLPGAMLVPAPPLRRRGHPRQSAYVNRVPVVYIAAHHTNFGVASRRGLIVPSCDHGRSGVFFFWEIHEIELWMRACQECPVILADHLPCNTAIEHSDHRREVVPVWKLAFSYLFGKLDPTLWWYVVARYPHSYVAHPYCAVTGFWGPVSLLLSRDVSSIFRMIARLPTVLQSHIGSFVQSAIYKETSPGCREVQLSWACRL